MSSSFGVIKRALFPLSLFIFSADSMAGGFQLWEQDVSGLGDYHAGAAAEADSAGTEFYNPAGMTRLKHQQVSFGAALIAVDVNYTGSAQSIGTQYVNDVPGDTINGVPNFHYVLPLPHHFAFGFGVTSPFGLATDYPDVSPVNTLATETKLESINFNPSIAYEINRYLSLGLGFDALYGSAIYDVDFLSPSTNDLSGWNYGYNAGALLQFTPQTRLGLSYRSEITIDAVGASSSDNLFSGGPISSQASASLPLPATSIMSLYHDFNSRFTMMATAFYTQWSAFKQLVLNNVATPTGISTLTTQENYRDTWNLALGGKYHFNKHISIEAGFGHDQTPTQLGYRDIRLPDNNRYAAALGINLRPSPGFLWSMGWTHFFVPSTPIDNSQSGDFSTSIGTETGDINVFGIQLSCDV